MHWLRRVRARARPAWAHSPELAHSQERAQRVRARVRRAAWTSPKLPHPSWERAHRARAEERAQRVRAQAAEQAQRVRALAAERAQRVRALAAERAQRVRAQAEERAQRVRAQAEERDAVPPREAPHSVPRVEVRTEVRGLREADCIPSRTWGKPRAARNLRRRLPRRICNT